MNYTIRKAVRSDVDEIFALIRELAEYEKAPHEVSNTPEQMLEDGFGDNPVFGCLVVEVDGRVEGISLYYIRYSTWKGKRLYLEDLVVREKWRGHGFGKALMDATIQEAKQLKCSGMTLQVLGWNKPAINFYKSYNMQFDGEWLNVLLEF